MLPRFLAKSLAILGAHLLSHIAEELVFSHCLELVLENLLEQRFCHVGYLNN